MIDAIVAGHICLDVIPDLSGVTEDQIEAFLQPGRLVDVGPMSYCTGGAVSNTGLALSRLGARTQLMGKVGDDLFGRAIQGYVNSFGPGLAEAMIVDPASSSSYTVVLSPPAIDRIFLHHPGPNDSFSADDVRYELLEEARLFHFGYPPLMKRMYEAGSSDLAQIFQRAKEMGVTTSLDMALPDRTSPAGRADWQSILRSVLPYVDIFVPSIEEILFMQWPMTYEALCEEAGGLDFLPLVQPELLSSLSRELMALGTKIVALKLGERGLYLRTARLEDLQSMGRALPTDPATWAGRELWAPCFQVEVVGTTGAGDATIAGLLAGLLRGLSPETAVTAAVAVGACNVEAADALSGVRPWEETWERVRAGWARHALVVDAPGWRLDGKGQVWVGPVGKGYSKGGVTSS